MPNNIATTEINSSPLPDTASQSPDREIAEAKTPVAFKKSDSYRLWRETRARLDKQHKAFHTIRKRVIADLQAAIQMDPEHNITPPAVEAQVPATSSSNKSVLKPVALAPGKVHVQIIEERARALRFNALATARAKAEQAAKQLPRHLLLAPLKFKM